MTNPGVIDSTSANSESFASDNQQRTTAGNTCCSVYLDMIDYNEAWKLQSEIVDARVNESINSDVILFLEHPAVFTLGRRGGLRIHSAILPAVAPAKAGRIPQSAIGDRPGNYVWRAPNGRMANAPDGEARLTTRGHSHVPVGAPTTGVACRGLQGQEKAKLC